MSVTVSTGKVVRDGVSLAYHKAGVEVGLAARREAYVPEREAASQVSWHVLAVAALQTQWCARL